jgi:hypothetical protein
MLQQGWLLLIFFSDLITDVKIPVFLGSLSTSIEPKAPNPEI